MTNCPAESAPSFWEVWDESPRKAMHNVRGGNYRKLMQSILPDLAAKARVLIAESGKLSALQVAMMAIEFNLPMKTTFEFLEYAEILPTGTWDRLADRGVTAGYLRQQAMQSVEG